MLIVKRFKKVFHYFRNHGLSATINRIFMKIKGKFFPIDNNQNAVERQNNNSHAPLKIYLIPGSEISRISMVTDMINASCLAGKVGAAILFSALFAEKKHARLRIITRCYPAQVESVRKFLSFHDIKLSYEIEILFVPSDREIDVFDNELFITTSWWTTVATMSSLPKEHIIWILQEDERRQYPRGDDYLLCEQVYMEKDIRLIISTKLLHDHLSGKFPNLNKNSFYFEPALVKKLFHKGSKMPGEKFKFMFFARPNVPKNLFNFGVNVIDSAIRRGILDLSQWDIIFVGKDIPEIIFLDEYIPARYENLSWDEYAHLIRTVDLALSLIYTPHPSYPTLDLAASGAVVVTNRCDNKKALDFYSKNILCGDLDKESMLKTLKSGIELALNFVEREKNYRDNKLENDWNSSFRGIFEKIDEVI